MRRTIGSRLALAALLAFTQACTRSGSIGGGGLANATLHLFVAKSPSTLNPLLTTTVVEQQLSSLAYDTLIVPDDHNRIRPSLARVVPSLANGGISRDGKTITFLLRKGVRWQDGQPFTSADVAFTLARIADPNVNITSRTGYDRIARVTTPDPATVVVTLKERFAPFVTYVGLQYPIMPKHLLEHSADINRDPIGAHPVGTGPYRFERWDRGSQIIYAANPDYFGGAPKIAHLSVAEISDDNTVALELRTHQVDFGEIDSSSAFEQLRRVAELRTATSPRNDFFAYALNTTSPLLRDVRVRRAISLAIDRANIVKKETYATGTAAYADLPPILWTTQQPINPYGFDPKAANALLDAIGWKRGPTGIRQKNGVALRLRGIDMSGNPTAASTDIAVAQMLHDVGIDVAFKFYSYSLYYETKRDGGPVAGGNFDLAAYAFFSSVDPQNDVIYSCATRPPNGYNFAFYCSPQMDALQHDSLGTLDPAHRRADVANIEHLAVTDVPYVFLYQRPALLAWNPRLQRTPMNLVNPWYDVRNWSFGPP